MLKIELNKSSSDVAAEGAILNEMLDIVAKRAALRTNDSAQGTGLESDVSSRFFDVPCKTPGDLNRWFILCFQFIILYACILLFAFTRKI